MVLYPEHTNPGRIQWSDGLREIGRDVFLSFFWGGGGEGGAQEGRCLLRER